ncbi:MAG: hypothetical protein EOO63_03765 [Hymenobacter sp.]|nr:MAG: hypothetical protein EOO63_03765 [Hymenobacter sp.]
MVLPFRLACTYTPMKTALSYWLLLALGASTALAQTPPKKPPVRKPTPEPKAAGQQPERWLKDGREPYPYFPEDFPRVPELVSKPFGPDDVYTYVEQMPTLPGQAGLLAISQTLNKLVVLPLDAPAGRSVVKFVVDKEGIVRQPAIAKSLRADVDSAVVAAARKLPRFTPGRQAGQVVAVSLTLPVVVPEPEHP